MKNKYIKSTYFDIIKDNLLTTEEFNKIKSTIVDPVILSKLEKILKSNYSIY